MIGVGGWGGRTEKHGPYIRLRYGKFIMDYAKGRGGSHGPQHEFVVTTRNNEHPITKGMPTKWLHAKDELYDSLRGPAENVTVLATAFSSKSKEDEPMIMTIDYGKGRVFHTPMGHADYSMKCVGFLAYLARGSEWAATGKVTFPVPEKFPSEDKVMPHDPTAAK
jgi:type 1 glutamine amidotransferase